MLSVFATPLFAFMLCGENITLGAPPPSWISIAQKENKLYRYQNCAVAIHKHKIIWYSKSIEVNGGLKVYANFDDASFNYGIVVFDNMDPSIGEESYRYNTIKKLNGAIISIRTSMHNLKRVEVYYKEGNLTKMRYLYPYKEKNHFILEVQYGQKP